MNLREEISLETGDVLLFRGTTWLSWFIEWFGWSSYSHVGIVVKNPKFLNPELEDGTYILESSWNNTPDAEDKKMKFGVQLHLLDEVLVEYPKGSVFVRHIKCERNSTFYATLAKVHQDIHDKPYDMNPWDWLCAIYNQLCPLATNSQFQQTNTFWCSSLVSYLFYQWGFISPVVNWSLICPKEFSEQGQQLRFLCPISKEKNIY